MWRKSICAAGGLFAVCAAAYVAPSTESLAQPSSFDARWLAVNPAQKADRIDGPKARLDSTMYFFDLPTVQTTVVVKDHAKPVSRPAPDGSKQTDGAGEPRGQAVTRSPAQPLRVLPHDTKRKDKLPVGCESSFSPVTTPVMANVSSRCLS